MSFQEYIDKQPEPVTDFFVPSSHKIELLQSILESQYGRTVPFDEAEEVGMQLISLYECLAHERTIITEAGDELG